MENWGQRQIFPCGAAKNLSLEPIFRYASGYTDNHIVRDGILKPGINFLHKPYSLRELALAVRRALDKSEK